MNKRQAKKAFKKKHGYNPVIIPHYDFFPWKNRGSYEHAHEISMPIIKSLRESLREGIKGG